MSDQTNTASEAIPATTAPANTANSAALFRRRNIETAMTLLIDWVGEDRAKEAAGRIAAAISAAAAAARRPEEIYSCTPRSVATCIATAALTGIMPGIGAAALAYVIPRRPRKDAQPHLQYVLNHRGLNALAMRCKQMMIATPIGPRDEIRDDGRGGVVVVSRDLDMPPLTYNDLRGVVVAVHNLTTGTAIHSGWVPKIIIDQRRRCSAFTSREDSPWSLWPIEMSMKTAAHYAIGRGWCVIDDSALVKALEVEASIEASLQQEQQEAGRLTEQPAGRRSQSDRLADLLSEPDDAPEEPEDEQSAP